MHAIVTTSIDINDEDQPKHNSYIDNEYRVREAARQIIKSKLVNAGIAFARTANIKEFEEFYDYISINIPKQPEPSWHEKVADDAITLIKEFFMEEIIDQLLDTGSASDDMYNDYDNGDGIFHETVVDQYYTVEEAIDLLGELYDHEEEDEGIWEGQNWQELLSTKAAYTYGNAVMSEWNDIISDINQIELDEDETSDTMRDKIDEVLDH